ncbi:hypothetical protein BIW11_03426 [Tropilaelaps mercedesae]|uniref:Uncharacterized protein n=1 Tax=Tropilaelaps mercedesae TaxID=418985 RepID=A0A1V9XM30_9ACAR|nr:hypothetical protein BIW11_03426 [Tropilaelaps mercedesae]
MQQQQQRQMTSRKRLFDRRPHFCRSNFCGDGPSLGSPVLLCCSVVRFTYALVALCWSRPNIDSALLMVMASPAKSGSLRKMRVEQIVIADRMFGAFERSESDITSLGSVTTSRDPVLPGPAVATKLVPTLLVEH